MADSTVLVVDDDPVILKLLEVNFEIAETDGDRQAENVVLVDEAAPRRARLRGRGGVRR